jgi:hypothetical protein
LLEPCDGGPIGSSKCHQNSIIIIIVVVVVIRGSPSVHFRHEKAHVAFLAWTEKSRRVTSLFARWQGSLDYNMTIWCGAALGFFHSPNLSIQVVVLTMAVMLVVVVVIVVVVVVVVESKGYDVSILGKILHLHSGYVNKGRYRCKILTAGASTSSSGSRGINGEDALGSQHCRLSRVGFVEPRRLVEQTRTASPDESLCFIYRASAGCFTWH